MKIELHPKLLDNEWLVDTMNSTPPWYLEECMDELVGFDVSSHLSTNLRSFLGMWARVPMWDDASYIIEWKYQIIEELHLLDEAHFGKNWEILVADTHNGGCGDIYDCVSSVIGIQNQLEEFNNSLMVKDALRDAVFVDSLNYIEYCKSYSSYARPINIKIRNMLKGKTKRFIDANLIPEWIGIKHFPLAFLVFTDLMKPWPYMNWNENPLEKKIP